ncbi:MAG: protein-disulfide reductase DsbD N-terminal domain-containing protein, partial [Burkholderiaceae bacterium]
MKQMHLTRSAPLLALLLSLLAVLAWLPPPAHAADDYLDPEAAFRFSAKMVDAKTVAVTYAIADGYYMYRERFQFRADGARLGQPQMPAGKIKFDQTFQKEVETYRGSVTITIPVEADGAFTLVAGSQGCADQGLCYAPMESQARLSKGGGGLLAAIGLGAGAAAPAQDTPSASGGISLA